MAKKDDKTLYTLDHANKLADREYANPNRRLLRLLRAEERLPDNLSGGAYLVRKRSDESK